ncbi:MAG: hypothetical protein LBU23_01845 [Planctomycetota bacterium]|jgi:hypothetical protein|nr:hypothetical protein [Planctomycetota bacterium]
MIITKKVITKLPLCYAIKVYNSSRGKRVMCAAQGKAGCISFSARDGSGIESVWGEPGGTMTIVQLGSEEKFLATQRFYTGFQAKDSCVIYVQRDNNGSYIQNMIFKQPYLHRFTVVDIEGDKWIVGSSMCDSKDFKDDWSTPGRVYAGRFSYPEPCGMKEIKGGICRNHGMYCGPLNAQPQVVIVTGTEGAFALTPPKTKGGEWKSEQLLDCEISELLPYDIDGDGTDELVTIEGFHGDRLNVYKNSDGAYKRIYSFPVGWGHALWCGKIFNKRSILIGYNSANSALLLLRPKPVEGAFSMESTMIDELQAYNNVDVWDDGEKFHIYAACRSDNVIMYTLDDA